MQLNLFADPKPSTPEAAPPTPEPPAFVALDLETTGLDAHTDRIIEVGAVRFVDSQVLSMTLEEGALQMLVNPGVDLEPKISRITGITQDMLTGQPAWEEAKVRVQDFLAPPVKYLIAHNMQFERDFLTAHDIMLDHLTLLDTWEMVRMFMPEAVGASLGAATHVLSIASLVSHRAAHDALATGRLFMRLWQRLRDMPDAAIQHVLAHALPHWPYHALFQMVATERNLPAGDTDLPLTFGPAGTVPIPHREPDTEDSKDLTTATSVPAAAGWWERLLQPANGTVAVLPCDAATSQVLARECVRWTAQGNGHLLLCLPAFQEFSYQARMLQSLQAFAQELAPDLQIAYRPNPRHLSDLTRLHAWKAGRTLNPAELSFLTRILYWCSSSPPHYRPLPSLFQGSYGPVPGNHVLWPLVTGTADSEPSHLAPVGDGFLSTTAAADAGSITVMDHDTWLLHLEADADFGQPFNALVVDDIWNLFHQIPAACTQTCTLETITYLQQQWDRLTGRESTEQAETWHHHLGRSTEPVTVLAAELEVLATRLERFRQALHCIAQEELDSAAHERKRRQNRVSRDVAQMSSSTHWGNMFQAWQDLRAQGAVLRERLDALEQILPAENHVYGQQIKGWQQEFYRVLQHLDQVLPDEAYPRHEETIRWMTLRPEAEQIQFNRSRIWTEELVQHHIRGATEHVLFLQRGRQRPLPQGFLSRQLGLTRFRHHPSLLPSQSELAFQIVVPDGTPDPKSDSYLAWIMDQIPDIVKQVKGCTLVLFARQYELRQVSDHLRHVLSASDTVVLTEKLDPWASIAAGLRRQGHKVLCGTFDILKQISLDDVSVQCAVVTCLPFLPPADADPIRARQFRQHQQQTGADNEFRDFGIPQVGYALLRVVDQLITPASPRGQLIVLDSRIRQRYLQSVTRPWPQADRQEPTGDRIAEVVRAWHAASRS